MTYFSTGTLIQNKSNCDERDYQEKGRRGEGARKGERRGEGERVEKGLARLDLSRPSDWVIPMGQIFGGTSRENRNFLINGFQ